MKKRVSLILTVVLLINLIGIVSALYECSGNISTETHSIDTGEIKAVNRINVGVINPSVGKAAEIFIDAREITITSEVPSVNITLGSGFHEINLTGLNDNIGLIKIDSGNEGSLEEKQIEMIGNLSFYVKTLTGTWSGEDANMQLLVGDQYLFLYGSDPERLKTVGSTEYLFGVSSSDYSGAIIEVSKCDGGTFTEIVDLPEQNNSNFNNSDNVSLQDENLSSQNVSISENNSEQNKSANSKEKIPPEKIYFTIIVVIILLVIIIVIFILFRVLHPKNVDTLTN
jgi:hypothetical protein